MIDSKQLNLLINGLVNNLFEAEFNRLSKQKLNIVAENRKVSANQFDGFFYQGEFYTDIIGANARRGVKSSLFSSLVPMIEAFLVDKKTVEFDKLRVKQALAIVLRDCKNAQDIRDSLPNQLAQKIDQIKDLPRTRPEGFTLENDPRKRKQYELLREKIEFYSVTSLLY